MRYSSGKFKLANPPAVQKPHVDTPISLIIAAVLSVLWAFGTLVYAINIQLANDNFEAYGTLRMIAWAVIGFIGPLLVAHSFLMNWRIGRWLLMLTLGAFYGLLAYEADLRGSLEANIEWIGVSVTLSLFLTGWWLFGSKRIRIYYSQLAGSIDKTQSESEPVPGPGPAAQKFAFLLHKIEPFFEWIGLALIVAVFWFALAMMDVPDL